MLTNFSLSAVPTDRSGVAAIVDVRASNPLVFCAMARAHNENLVVYEALCNPEQTELLGIEAYWLDLDPSYRARARKRGVLTDRVELTKLDHYAFGMNIVEAVSPTHLRVAFARAPERVMDLRLGGQQAQQQQQQARLWDPEVQGVAYLEYAYAHAKKLLGLSMPLVSHVDVYERHGSGGKLTRRTLQNQSPPQPPP